MKSNLDFRKYDLLYSNGHQQFATELLKFLFSPNLQQDSKILKNRVNGVPNFLNETQLNDCPTVLMAKKDEII